MDGTPYTIGEREFRVPRLRVGTFKRVTLMLKGLDDRNLVGPDGGAPDPKQADAVIEWFETHCRALRELLLRNYPDLTVEELCDLVDCDSITSVFLGAMAAAGRKRGAPGEAPNP